MEVTTGTTITFASGFLAEILDVDLPELSRESIDTTHMGTTNAKTYIPSTLIDVGELSCDLGFDPSASPPINLAPENVTILFPSGTSWSFSGFMTGFNAKAPLEDKMTASVTIKASGEITITPA